MKILFTGDYLPNYNRTHILRKGLESLGHQVVDSPFKKKSAETQKQIIGQAHDCDFIFLPSFTHQQVSFVKKTLPNHYLVFDPLISRHLTRIHDYKLASPYSLSALRNYLRDKNSMASADFVITDTKAHLDYFHRTFKIPLEKMGVVYIGNDFSMYSPQNDTAPKPKYFRIGFYGGFIPLQGVMNILAAVNILKDHDDIHFELIGNGFEFEKATAYAKAYKLNNLSFPGWLEESQLAKRLCTYDLCLGIFGETKKSHLVIPNKIYHYAACAKPILTQDTVAIREIFTPNKDITLCDPTPMSIANSILDLKSRPDHLQSLGVNAHQNLQAHFSAQQVAQNLLNLIEKSKSR